MQNNNNIYLQLIQQTIYTIHYYFLPLSPSLPLPLPSGPGAPYGLVAQGASERRGVERPGVEGQCPSPSRGAWARWGIDKGTAGRLACGAVRLGGEGGGARRGIGGKQDPG